MSASKFEEKRRVAHAVNPVAEEMRKQLELKKMSLSSMAATINHGKVAPIFNTKPKPVRKYNLDGTVIKKARKAESEEEFLDDDYEEDEKFMSESEEEEEDMGLSDEEDRKRKKATKVANGAVKKTPPQPPKKKESTLSDSEDEAQEGAWAKSAVPVKPSVSPPKPVKKERTLSDDSDDAGAWMSKPRMMTGKASKKDEPKKPKKKIIISSSEDEGVKYEESDEDEIPAKKKKAVLDSSPESAPAPRLKKEKKVKKKKNKGRRGGSHSDEDQAFSGSDGEAVRETDSEASDEDAAYSAATRAIKKKMVEFFNTSSKESLLSAPRIVEKIAEKIMEIRPFDSYEALRSCISSIPRVSGNAVLDAFQEHMENKGVLEQILDDCRVHSSQVEESTKKEEGQHVELPLIGAGMNLHGYQQEGVEWLVEMHNKGLNCVLADEMGLGKTIQIVAFLSWLKQQQVRGPHLIVVPSSTVENWMSEMKKWCPTLKFITYYGTQDERKDIRHAAKKRKDTVDVLLTTYNMIGSKSDDKKFFKNFSINYVVFDEGHMLKNCSTDRYKNLMKIKTQRKILLTGTPLQNNLIELISLMYFTITKIFNKYCDDVTQLLQHFKQQRPALEGSDSNLYQRDRIEQAKAILQPYILRRVKSQVLSQLPPKTEEIIEVEMEEGQAELYEDVVDGLVKDDTGEASNAYGGLMRLRQAANHPLLRRKLYDDADVLKIAKVLCAKEKSYAKKKPEYLAEELEGFSDFQLHQLCEKFHCTNKYLLEESLALKSGKIKFIEGKLAEIKEKGDKVLIFSQFTSMLDILEVFLRLRGYTYARLDGTTPVLERLEMINAYNENPSQFVFLLSTRAGGLGINLVSANHIILHDIDFNPYNDKQAEDRCHRMGQKKPVYVTRLIAKDTIEVDINRLARLKLQLEKDVTEGSRGLKDEDGGDTPPMSGDEVRKMLSDVVQRSPTQRKKSGGGNGVASANGVESSSHKKSKSPTKRRNSHSKD
ncbi:hypothetical protein PENTCL1PPCAC_12575 [Pristionchus entomophagus]|uniref:SWI/SNF-related matrix-associated actin-dependent regulator of chromatin subfamily A containing DEAD/H box 1 homolog n=1 Tax=Pristionchus entomophagus TaxID=358040 RepID=A0AAV5T5L9_9BILA|nr:hypothetical protein PENTCL1PPCAC_12575 [Pristionchus entomophagus]